jgi:acyl carrier protein
MQLDQPQTINERIQTLLVNALQVPPDQVSADLQFGDLPQWDSMGHMEVMILLEAEFGIEINPDTITNLTSFEAIREYLEDNGYARI